MMICQKMKRQYQLVLVIILSLLFVLFLFRMRKTTVSMHDYPTITVASHCTIDCFRTKSADFLTFYERIKLDERNFGNRYPIFPLISGDGFRYYATHICDESNNCAFDPSTVTGPSVIFVKTDEPYLAKFFEKASLIRHPFIVITHNGDNSPDPKFYLNLKNDLLKYWAGSNLKLPNTLAEDATKLCHKKLISIPIGYTNRYNRAGDPSSLIRAMKINRKHDKLVLLSFNANTNQQERQPVKKLFAEQSWVTTVSAHSQDDFYSILAEHKFFFSPFGNGVDCHRTWEGLYLGSIPIIRRMKEHAIWEKMFEELPVLFVDKWSDVTEDFLHAQYQNFAQKTFDWDKLFMMYWAMKLSQP